MLDRAYLERLLASNVAPDVLRWCLALIFASMRPSDRRAERDRWLRAAAALIPGSRWHRAQRVAELAAEVKKAMPTSVPSTFTAAGCVAAGLLACPWAPSARTIHRMLGH